MCGIWASVGIAVCNAALDKVAHRGPDGEGLATFDTGAGPLVLGHRRLAIYDVSERGAQPMRSKDGRFTITFNGAIYNFKALRTELQEQGASFQSETDTEVILEAFGRWGRDCIARFNGMFAFVIWDAQRSELTIARDRFGEKPLHLAILQRHGGQALLMGSEIAQLLAAAPELAQLNKSVAGDFLNVGAVDWDNRTFFQNIVRLPPASILQINLADARVLERLDPLTRAQRYWSVPTIDPSMKTSEAAAEALRPALERSVALRMAADVPVGTCLSGGLDSTTIAVMADRILPANSSPFLCVSAVFDSDGLDGRSLSERPFLEAALKAGRFEPHIIAPSSQEVADAFIDIVRHQGEPFASASICVQYFVFKAARNAGAKVMLDGQGADELFGGYAGMLGSRLADLVFQLRLKTWREELDALAADGADMNVRELFRATYSALLPEFARRGIGAVRGTWPPRNWLVTTSAFPSDPPSHGRSKFDALSLRMVSQLSLPSLLRYEDRNAMAHAVESRLPFLDTEVSDLALRMPASAKVASGETKRALRLAGEGLVPHMIRHRRRKLGFVAPQDEWIASELGQQIRQSLQTAQKDWADFMDRETLKTLEPALGVNSHLGEMAFRVHSFIQWTKEFGVRA